MTERKRTTENTRNIGVYDKEEAKGGEAGRETERKKKMKNETEREQAV